MTNPHAPLASRARIRRLALAGRLMLAAERLGAALVPVAALGCGCLALALSGLLPLLPGWLHAGVLAGAALGAGATLRRGFRGFRWPGAGEALRRLERDNHLPHRPLQTLNDRPAGDDALAAAVWLLHCETAARAAGPVRLHPQTPALAARDRFGLRLALGAALLATLVLSWGEGGTRLAAAFDVRFGGGTAPAVLDLWLTPPAHTGLPPLLWRRTDTAAAPVTVPAGSAVVARVSGGGGLPVLIINGTGQALTALDDDRHFEARATLRSGGGLEVRQDGRSLGRWPLLVRPEMAPAVTFTAAPAQTGRGALRIAYRAEDAYGVASVSLIVRPEAAPAETAGSLTLALPVSGTERTRVDTTASHDLTASPWAGLPVRLQLTATSVGGLSGVSEERTLVLPERSFGHPVARALIGVRRELALRGEAARPDGARALGALSVRPEAFDGDAVVYLALRVAVARLGHNHTPEALAELRELLWQTALRLEDGTLGLTRRDLDTAERALREALDGAASDGEIRQRIDELAAALGRYLESLERQQAGMAPPSDLERTDLDAMLQSLRDLSETGARDEARRLLSELGEVLESLRTGGEAASPAEEGMRALAKQLQDITVGQRALLDRSFEAARQQEPPPSPRPDPATAAEESALRHQLGTVLTGLGEAGEIPQALGAAERAMHAAEQALAAGDGEAALAAEGEAVEKLRQGQQDLSRALAPRLSGAGGRDPLGRRRPGIAEGAPVRLPEQREMQRAREILEELRRRAGEPARPRQELDYIERLLRQF
ncbi:MAG: DUF4175 family protein [Rhodospirillaceae bacterium]